MARTLQTIRSYFLDHTLEYRISKADLERLTDVFYRMDRSGYVLPRHQNSAKTELPALANYGRAVNGLLAEWQDIRLAFDREMKRRDDDGVIQGLLDQLDVLLQQAEAVTIPDPAAAVHQVFIARLCSERAYCQQLFDDVDDAAIEQCAADFQAKARVFRAEFPRLLHSGA